MPRPLSFTLNGQPVRLEVDGERPLLWVLRSDLGLTGTKFGCGEAVCGTCTVVVDDQAVRSCSVRAREVEGKRVLTIEGLARGGRLHPLQEAFVAARAFQCGYCTPGMIMNAYALLLRHPRPSEADLVAGMDDNLCRCGSHLRILQAVRAAAEKMSAARP